MQLHKKFDLVMPFEAIPLALSLTKTKYQLDNNKIEIKTSFSVYLLSFVKSYDLNGNGEIVPFEYIKIL